jgi:ferredoxin-nitrite reductase
VLVRPEQIPAFTQAILDLFRAKGSREKRNRARLRFLVEDIGIGGVLEWLEQQLPFRLEPCVREPIPASAGEQLIGWIRQNNPNLWAMGLSVPLGRLTWHQLEGLAVLSKRWGNGQLRTTVDQGILVINIPTGFKTAAATDAAALGLSIHPQYGAHGVQRA